MISKPNSECGGIVKLLGLKEIFSLSEISISFLISTALSIGFSMLMILHTVSRTIDVNSIFYYGSGAYTVSFIL